MRQVFLMAFTALVAVLPLHGQDPGTDVIYYKFDTGEGRTFLNYARTDPSVPVAEIPSAGVTAHGPAITPDSDIWVPGRFGTAIRGGEGILAVPNGVEVDTGWSFQIAEDLTIAMFVKNRIPHPTNDTVELCSTESLGGGISQGRLSVGMTTAGFLFLDWRPSSSGDFFLSTLDAATAASSDWTHLAITIERSTGTATFFLNGVQAGPPIVEGELSPLATNGVFEIGSINSFYDIDEFRVCLRAVPPGEILAWATEDLAAVSHFGEACAPFGYAPLLAARPDIYGLPYIGNSGHALDLFGFPGAQVRLGLGFSRTFAPRFGVSLPFDLGLLDTSLGECLWHSSVDLEMNDIMPATGSLTVPVPIPNFQFIEGIQLYCQALYDIPALGAVQVTNPVALSIGQRFSPPEFSGIAPSSGSFLGGDVVAITGDLFDAQTTVLFDGIPATNVTVVSPQLVTCTTPMHLPGTVDVVVTNVAGSASLPNAFSFVAQLTITGVSPTTPQPGSPVVVSGFAFDPAATVTIDGAAVSLVSVSSTQIVFTAPASTACDATLEVMNPGGAMESVLFNPQPVITSVSVNTGPVAGGTVVVITGQNLTTTAPVTVGGVAASILTQSAGVVVLQTPPGSVGTAPIVITGPLGCSVSTTFTYF